MHPKPPQGNLEYSGRNCLFLVHTLGCRSTLQETAGCVPSRRLAQPVTRTLTRTKNRKRVLERYEPDQHVTSVTPLFPSCHKTKSANRQLVALGERGTSCIHVVNFRMVTDLEPETAQCLSRLVPLHLIVCYVYLANN